MRTMAGKISEEATSLERRNRWIYLPPTIHLCAHLISYIGLLIPNLQYFAFLFTFVLVADLPISIPAYLFGWRYSGFAVMWIFTGGTLWWYVLSRAVNALFIRYARQHGPQLRSRKKAVRSPAIAAGSSAGAKCPPRGKTVQRWMLYTRSRYERGGSPSGTVSCAKTPNAVGVPT